MEQRSGTEITDKDPYKQKDKCIAYMHMQIDILCEVIYIGDAGKTENWKKSNGEKDKTKCAIK